jgi:hypothetical protein
MSKKLFASAATALILLAGAPALAESPVSGNFEAHAENGGVSIDYRIWSDILRDIVLNVGPSDRDPQVSNASAVTGSLINTGNRTRYRFESNRVVYHLMEDDYREAITAYRQELEALPAQVDWERMSSDEQLAFWLNLHNVAVIEQVMLNFPARRIDRLEADGVDAPLFDAKILNVAGTPLSLNDIRVNIVYELWEDPRVMYGFFNGAIGGPNIRREAYTGDQVWNQLNSNAREFVNSLRGVDIPYRTQKVSSLYAEAAPYFPVFETDLRGHLLRFANEDTADDLNLGRPLQPEIYEWGIADLTNGSSRCGGPNVQVNYGEGAPGRQASQVSNTASCSVLPQNARILMNYVLERRFELLQEGRIGDVRTIDIPTDEDGNPVGTAPAPEDGEQ